MRKKLLKKEIRILGIDDTPFNKFQDKECRVIGVVFRGGEFLDGVVSTTVEVDGMDATLKLIDLVNRTKFHDQLRAVMLGGIAVAGFNVINIKRLSEETGVPVIVVIRDYPDFDKMYTALRKLGMLEKIKLIERMPVPTKVDNIYVQYAGIELREVMQILKLSCTRSHFPEPLRVAHLIGQGLVFGESKGRA